jgi:hypothetical protein
MQDMDIISQQIKNAVLGEENKLEEATKELKRQTEKDIEGDFKLEKYQELMQERKAIIGGGYTAAKTKINEAKGDLDDVKSRKKEPDFKKDLRRGTISSKDYNDLYKLMQKYQFLYTHFAAMFYAENRINDKISSVVDLQRSRSLQKQNLDLIKENLPKVIDRSFEENDRINQLESKLEGKEEEISELKEEIPDEEVGSEEVETLRQRIEKLENQLDKKPGNSVSSKDKESQREEDSEEEELEAVDAEEILEKVETTDFQEEMLHEIAEGDYSDSEELADEMDRPYGVIQNVAKGLLNKAEDEGLKSEQVQKVTE